MTFFTKKALLPICLLTLLFSGCASSPASDSAATSETISSEFPTLASTSVAICEILDALDYDRVLGVPETARSLPERYQTLPTIGAPMTPDYEIIRQLNPDYVLSPLTLESTLAEAYTNAGISSIFLDLSTVDGMYQGIASLGKLLGRETEATSLVSAYETYMKTYNTAVSNDGESPSILLLMAFPDGFFLIATEHSYVGDLLRLAGARNVYGEDYATDESGFLTINTEDLIQKTPDKIFVFAHYSEEDAFSYMRQQFQDDTMWQYLSAATNGEIYYLPSAYFGMSASLNWTEALDYLQPLLYGE